MYSNDLQEMEKGFNTTEIVLQRDHRHNWVFLYVSMLIYAAILLVFPWTFHLTRYSTTPHWIYLKELPCLGKVRFLLRGGGGVDGVF